MQGQQLVEALASTVDSITEACDGLTAEQWARPTGCPGWSVQDNLAHLVGLGGYETPAAAVSFERCATFAGPAKGELMPDGTTLVWRLEGPYAGEHAWSFTEGKATRLDAAPAEPTVRLTADSETFMVLCCGRSDARPQDVRVEGDAELAARLLADPGFTP